MNSNALDTDPMWHAMHNVSGASGAVGMTTTTSSGTVGTVPTWITMPSTTAAPTYTISGASSWPVVEPPADCCRFCDKHVEIGLIIQSKTGKRTVICVSCAKDYMGSKKMKKIFDLVEPLATMAELAKG